MGIQLRRVGAAVLVLAWAAVASAGEVGAPAPRVRVATRVVSPGPYDVTLPERVGPLRALETRVLAFEVGGRVEALAEEGRRVGAAATLARLDDDMERSRLRQSKAVLRTAESDLGRVAQLRRRDLVADSHLERSVTDVNVRRAEQEAAEEAVSRKRMAAPWTGVVVERHVEPGEIVAPGQPVLTFMNLDALRVEVGVPGYAIARVTEGQRAWVRVAGLADERFEGRVERVAAAAADGSHLFEVEVVVDAAGGRLRPGMTARVEIVVEEIERAVAVPTSVVVERGERRVVFFVVDGHAREVDVTEAPIHRDRFVLTGPVPSEQLVVRGQRDVVDGVAVDVDDRILGAAAAP